ncbi:MAG: hypothetical protein A2Z20_09105 [Bdellovibrionales bacterium RBG_16_40_8]|nr:MAG: hypothetical protein A2Z20_09105 [Bdellovibrionales bacterium RBG_16_40_8]
MWKVALGIILGGSVWAAKAPVIGSPDAPVGGTFYRNLEGEPATLNPLRGTDYYSSVVEGYAFDSLLMRNIETFEFEPALAEKYDLAKDGKSITFTLRQNAKFHDGTPVTVEDVKFSFDVNFDSKLADAVKISYFENIEKAEIISPTQIKFIIKRKYFGNVEVLGGMEILPRAYYGDLKKKMNKTMMGSGPYMLEKYDQGKSIVLKRNPNWWGFDLPQFRGYYKFDKIFFRLIKDENAVLETFKKGDLDFTGLTPEQYEKKTDGDIWGKTLIKEAVQNSGSKSTPFLGFNLRNLLFKNKDVRKALSLLVDRKMMIEKFFYNKNIPATGPWYQQNPYADPKAKPIPFDPAAARVLFTKAGWADSNKDGVLDKIIDNKPTDFRFTIIVANPIWEKYLTVYKEELKKAGVDVSIKLVEWNAFQKLLDEGSFEAVALSWTGSIEYDPKQIWHSESIQKGASNFIAYSNPEVDKLIDKAREELNSEKRKVQLRKAYSMIANDYPYVFLWNAQYSFYAINKRVQQVKPTYKYDIGLGAWWLAK